jgi:hypothetical protein
MNKKIILIIGLMSLSLVLVWGIKNYLPSVVEPQKQCTSPKVVDDLSKELMRCYDNIDRCNNYLEACVKAYLQLKPGAPKP